MSEEQFLRKTRTTGFKMKDVVKVIDKHNEAEKKKRGLRSLIPDNRDVKCKILTLLRRCHQGKGSKYYPSEVSIAESPPAKRKCLNVSFQSDLDTTHS